MSIPALELEGVLTGEQAWRTGEFIRSIQLDDGSIPWSRDGRFDPWDHVEAAMGLVVSGRVAEGERAYRWLARTQRADGSWPMLVTAGVVEDAGADTNHGAYLAAGLWHHHLVTGTSALLRELWPTLDRAIAFVLRQQHPGGEIAWAVSAAGRVEQEALRTGSASILHSLGCALEIAEHLGHTRPRWEHAHARLGEALAERPDSFADRGRFSMDWYYPVLAGALRGEAGSTALQAKWGTFVWPGEGARCVADRPWVTAAESSELALALDAVGRTHEAITILGDIQRMRDEETGGYWTGYVVDDDTLWPIEQTTWTAAAVLLAVDAVTRTTGGSGLFRDPRPSSHPSWSSSGSEAIRGSRPTSVERRTSVEPVETTAQDRDDAAS